MKVTLKDIAAASGYSINTVSHALRDLPDISQATKDRIRAVAAELEYIPDLRASGIKSGKSNIISIILPDITNPHFTIVFREIEEFFRKVGITPFFMNTNEDPQEEMNAVRLSVAQNVDGVILCPTQADQRCIALLQRSGVPFVLIGRHFSSDIQTHCVVCDDKEGARLAAEHLIGLGHRRIAYIKTADHISSSLERFAGYRQALSEAGIPFDPALVLQLPLTGQSSTSIRRFLQSHPQCTAVLAFSDILAYKVILELRGMGKTVPEDISVMGFDNICSDYTLPTQLSSVSVSKKNMAQTASELLYALMQGDPRQACTHILPTRLFLRQTTAPVRSS